MSRKWVYGTLCSIKCTKSLLDIVWPLERLFKSSNKRRMAVCPFCLLFEFSVGCLYITNYIKYQAWIKGGKNRVFISWSLRCCLIFQLQNEQQKEPDRERPVLRFAATSLPSLILHRWVRAQFFPVVASLAAKYTRHRKQIQSRNELLVSHFHWHLSDCFMWRLGENVSWPLVISCKEVDGEEMQKNRRTGRISIASIISISIILTWICFALGIQSGRTSPGPLSSFFISQQFGHKKIQSWQLQECVLQEMGYLSSTHLVLFPVLVKYIAFLTVRQRGTLPRKKSGKMTLHNKGCAKKTSKPFKCLMLNSSDTWILSGSVKL